MLSGFSYGGVGGSTTVPSGRGMRYRNDGLPNGEQSASPNGQQSPKTNLLLGNGITSTELQLGPAFLRKLKRVYRKRQRVVEKRVDLNTKKRDCAYARSHELDACEAFDRAAEQFVAKTNNTFRNEFRALHTALEKLQESRAHLEIREEQVRSAEKAVVAREDELQEEESSFYSRLQKLNFSDHSQSESSSSQSTRSEGTRFPPLLRQYYESSQQASFLRGRLHEFQAEHREQVEKRKTDKELNRLVVPSEKAFLEDYFETLTAMYQEYYTAKNQAAALKNRCRQLNVDIEDGEDTLSDLAALDTSVIVEKKLIHFVALNKPQYKGVNPLEVLLFGYTDTTARVNNWLTGVHKSQPHDSPETQMNCEPPTSAERGIDDIIVTTTTSNVPSIDLATPDDYPFRAPSDNQCRFPFLLRETNFPGEAPNRRYSDPALFQDTSDVPYLPGRRPRSIR